MHNKKSITFYTIGCRVNQSETHVLENVFKQAGWKVSRDIKQAGIAVINTCTVTQNCDADTRKLAARIAKANPLTRIALIGCQAELQKEQLKTLPNVSWIVGNEKKMDLISIVGTLPPFGQTEVITPPISSGSFTLPAPGISRYHTRANLKIQDGCDSFCSFCTIPYARGRSRSRSFEDIIREAQCLALAGHQETVLTGINIGNYNDKGKNLADIVKELNNIDGIKRIRLSSIEPENIPGQLIDIMAGTSKLCRHLHIPLQHANNEILKSMNRKYTFEKFLKFARIAVETVPGLCIGTDIIVGFPGETDTHFDDMSAKLADAPVHYFHVFSYSQRPLAPSRNFSLPVKAAVIGQRSQRLRQLGRQKRRAYYESFAGTIQEVLFEQQKDGYWKGLTDQFIHVRVKSNKNLANNFAKVKLREVEQQEVLGTLA